MRRMAWTKLRVASGWFVLLGACGSVEESNSTSATVAGDETSATSDGPASGAEADEQDSTPVDEGSTQGSASVDDTGPDPTDATAEGTTDGGDTSSGADSLGTSTTMPVDPTTDDGEVSTTDPMPSACDPAGDDTACDTCVKGSCCAELETCAADADCWCVATCVGDGGMGSACGDLCGVDAPPAGAAELGGCAALFCGGTCGFG